MAKYFLLRDLGIIVIIIRMTEMKKNMFYLFLGLLVSSCSLENDIEDGFHRELGLYKPLELSDSLFVFDQNGGEMWCSELTRTNNVGVAGIGQYDENGNLVKYVQQDLKQSSDSSVLSCNELTVCYYQKDYKFKIQVSQSDSPAYNRWQVNVWFPCLTKELLQVIQK